ncbi:MAG: response regulator [Verrucomicrobia bacterium]|nr:response regulator [Verrucomicrobiota bacterium]
METRHKILLLDDDPDLLDVYREILGQLPSRPEIRTASSGARAIAMLEGEPFSLLITDLKMPKMDGLQVLSIVRRKHPELRTVVLTSVAEEQFRSRVYALGVDLFWQKPGSEEEIKLFLDCIESLLGREVEAGFRGVQSKSLVDIVQLECISQSSSLLRITNGPLSGRIWINDGEVIDAETDGARGEEAFQKILAWKAGNFESLPAEANRPQTIFKSYNALLLETAQAIDESRHSDASPPQAEGETPNVPVTGLSALAQVDGVEFVLAVKTADPAKFESRGLENAHRLATWTHASLDRFRALGERLQAGPVEQIHGIGLQRHVALAEQGDAELCVGWVQSLSADALHDRMRKILALWGS